MSQNKFMHPRNIYRNPPSFKELAVAYPEFRKHAKQDIKGKVTIDFKDPEALRALTTTLMKKDFGLNIEIPTNHLVPTLPLRLNYLLWIEDIIQLKRTSSEEQIIGVDIGTGACCIYPLLAAKTNRWKMLATEVDPESVSYALKNVEKNQLQSLITVKQVEAGMILKNVINSEDQYNFTMCNPPFFSNEKEADSSSKSRSDSRPPPHNVKTGCIGEVVFPGGERAFILKMINESAELKNAVKVYTTMIGQKSSLKQLKTVLESVGVTNSALTEFCQGHTTRWGLAWTFFQDLELESLPKNKKKKEKPPMKYVVPAISDPLLYAVNNVSDKLKQLFTQLQIECVELKRSNQLFTMEILARKNTWSNQRRKKREQKIQQSLKETKSAQSEETVPEIARSDTTTTDETSLKRKSESDAESINKKMRCDDDKEHESSTSSEKKENTEDTPENSNAAPQSPKHDSGDQQSCILKAVVSVRKVDNEIHIEMMWLEGSAGRDAVHQILQYIKNNLKIE